MKNRSLSIYERLREIQKDPNKHFFTFSNEFCKYATAFFHYFSTASYKWGLENIMIIIIIY